MSEEFDDWYAILYGMIQDGMSKTEALAALSIMDCPTNTITAFLTIYDWRVRMRKVKEVSKITVEFQRDELLEILDIMSTVRDDVVDKTTIQVAASWANTLNELLS